LKELHSNLGTIRTIWANWKHVIKICIYYKYFSELQQLKSKLDQLKQLHSNLGKVGKVKNILKSGHEVATHHSNQP